MNKKAQLTNPFLAALSTIAVFMLWAFILLLLAAGIKWSWGLLLG